MTQISAKRHENAAYWFADTDRELRWVVWFDPAYGGNAGQRGIVVEYSNRHYRREQPRNRTDVGRAADYETAEKLAHEALTALAAERDQRPSMRGKDGQDP